MGGAFRTGGFMTDQDFLMLLKEVAKKAKPFHDELFPIEDLDQDLSETGLDSLDMLMCTVYLCEVFDIEDEKSQEMQVKTPRECMDFLKQWGRRQPQSFEEAVRMFR